MKTKTLFWLFALLVVVAPNLFLARAEDDCLPEVTMGEFMGVQAFSNDPYTGTSNGCYQCVQYFKRFEQEIFNLSIGRVGSASQIFEKAKKGDIPLIAYSNGDTFAPMPSDAICFSGGDSGHVAVVTSVSQSMVRIIEQNWPGGCYRDLLMNIVDGKYFVGSEEATYRVQGWLRPYGVLKIGTFVSGTICEPIQEAYQSNGAQPAIGLPVAVSIDGEARSKEVWEWELCYTQVFDGGSLGQCAILYDRWANCGQAFVMHGQLWQYYKTNGGPYLLLSGIRIGGPVGSEQYAHDDQTNHVLVVQEFANGYLAYDTVTGVSSIRPKLAGGGDPDFTIAIVPGNGIDLTLTGWPQSTTSIYLVSSSVADAVTYQVFQTGVYIGDLDSNLEMTVTDLIPATSYTFEVVALDLGGGVLDQAFVTVSTKARDDPLPSSFTVWTTGVNSDGCSLAWESVPSGYHYQVFVDSALQATTEQNFFTVSGFTQGSNISVYVCAQNASYQPLGQSETINVQLSARPQYVLLSGPSEVFFGGKYSLTIGVKNGSLGNINNLIGGVYPFSSSTCKILNGESDEYLPVNYPAVIPPGATVAVAQVQIEVLDYFPSNGQLQVMAQGDAYWEAVGRVQSVSLGNFHLPFGSFVDLSLNLPDNLGQFACTQPVFCPINISNNATSGSPVCRLEISVEGNLLVSVLVPELAPAETWQTSFCLGRFDLGTYAVDIAIDPDNQVVEGRKDNNVKQCQFTVSLPTPANLAVTDLTVSLLEPTPGVIQSCFSDNFNRTILGPDWETFASSGSVSLQNGVVCLQNGTEYAGLKLVKEGFASLQDFTVSFDFDKTYIPTQNQTTEVVIRSDNDRWIVLSIKDKETFWVWFYDSDGNSACTYADLAPGRYQLTAAGNQVRFANAEGLGTPVFVELETTVVQPGSLTFKANEETVKLDNIQVKLTGPVMPPDAFRAGNPAYVVWTASNLGQTDSVPCSQTVYFGSESLVVDLPAIAAESSQEFYLPFYLTVLGGQVASVTVDSENLLTEPNEQDNSLETTINVLPSLLPNLTVALDSLPTQLRVGDTVIVSGAVANTNTQAAPACQLTLTFGEQSVVIDLPATLQSQTFSQQFELTKAGDQTVTAKVDPNNAVVETSETDNSQSQTVTVLPPPLPDLTIASLTLAKTEYLTSENPQLNLVVSNQGNAESPACQLMVQTQDQTVIAQVAVPAIPAGQSQTLTATLPNLAAGSQTIVVVVDFGNAIAESNENNNTSQIQVTVSNPPRPDLLVSQTTCQSYRWFLGKVNFTAQVKNNGEQASGPSQIGIAVPEMKKTYQKAIAGLNPGQTATFDLTLWSTPKALIFQVTADSQNQVTESNEQNNFTQVKKSF